MYSLQKLCPVCSATWLSDALCMVQYEVCWLVGSASTGRMPQQLTRLPFKYLKYPPISTKFKIHTLGCGFVLHTRRIIGPFCNSQFESTSHVILEIDLSLHVNSENQIDTTPNCFPKLETYLKNSLIRMIDSD